MVNSKQYDERINAINLTIQNKRADRVPIICSSLTWAYYYNGFKPLDGLNDINIARKVLGNLCSDFYWDGMTTGHYMNNKKLYELLGGGLYYFTSDGTLTSNPDKIKCMERNEYPELMEDPYHFITSKALERRYEFFNGGYSNDKDSKFFEILGEIDGVFNERKGFIDIIEVENGLVSLTDTILTSPVDLLMGQFRGIKEIIKDIKEIPDIVKAAGIELLPYTLNKIKHLDNKAGCTVYMPLHLPAFLSPSDFAKVYWPSFKLLINLIVAKGHHVLIVFEKNVEHLYDFFQELPPNRVVGWFEGDDLKKAKSTFGKSMCIMGGMPVEYLQYETEKRCIDYAKKLIDELAYDGGYLFCTDKAMVYENDGNPKNLIAVNRFVHEYGMLR